MNITLFTRPKSVLTVGLALLLAFDPNLIFQWTGLVLGDAGTLLGRILGLVYLGIAIELWFVRSNSDLPARNALLTLASISGRASSLPRRLSTRPTALPNSMLGTKTP